ncbi:hypothetical protein E1B28_000610 [Marasmius oreades]|uniref:Uncharacterized protein n=1 Tax=Marasmius oreades TaxID=181124 RepID=A0A9P8AEJ1_9AGAR|nr:uncharacterized protein E1B28_000610 [Marasmius oreades]KAG7098697.1 hypothetical protein E1B28_000610 [Marasmius oreades]
MSSASTSSTSNRPKKRFTRQQLLKHLEILNTLPINPPPHALPPSPPCSRESSPALPLKRKSDLAFDSDRQKRPRTGSLSDRQQSASQRHQQSQQPSALTRVSNQPPAYSSRSEPTEDGEVAEEVPPPSVSVSKSSSHPSDSISSAVPIRRPKRGVPSGRWFEQLHDTYHAAGRKLKYSGDARFWSTYPSTHKEYRPLTDPPPPNSSYHKYGGLIARLELLDALVCFTYSLWCRDYIRRACNPQTWSTIEAFLVWCKAKWHSEEGINDAEKAFCGLIWMIEAFIHTRKVVYSSRTYLDPEIDKVVEAARNSVVNAISEAERSSSTGSNSALLGDKPQSTPPMLPSPASIGPTNSANSTPTNREGTSTSCSTRSTSISPSSVPPALPVGPAIPIRLLPSAYQHGAPVPPHVTSVANKVSVSVTPQLIGAIKDQTAGINAAASSMNHAQQSLTLPILARFFPRTFARMVHSTLSPTDEHEPDIEDEEGELFWPGQCINGEGLGWVCLMGQAMIREFGKAYGYKGLKGVVPKPEQSETHHSGHNYSQRPLPHGPTPGSNSAQR